MKATVVVINDIGQEYHRHKEEIEIDNTMSQIFLTIPRISLPGVMPMGSAITIEIEADELDELCTTSGGQLNGKTNGFGE